MSYPAQCQPDQPGVAAQPGSRIGVLVVDDHPAVRAGVCRLLDDQPDMRVAAPVSTAIAAVDAVDADIDVAVIDYHLGDRTGLWVARRLSQGDSPPRVLVYSAFSDDALAVAAVIAGVDGLLGKSAIGEELCLAVRQLARGERYLPVISPTVARAMSARVDPRLRPIFLMLVQDIAPARILEALQISSADLDAARDAILSMLNPVTSGGAGAPRRRCTTTALAGARDLRPRRPERCPS